MNLLDFVFPEQCGACGCIGSGLCAQCLPWEHSRVRRVSGLEVRALASYDPPTRRAVHALKDGRRDVARALGERLARHIAAPDILVPVPTTPSRRRVRGVDGVVEMTLVAAARAHATVLQALECVTGDHQRGKSRSQRLTSFGRFRCNGIVTGATVTLVDDVCTTGTTLEDCATALRAAGALVAKAIVVALVD